MSHSALDTLQRDHDKSCFATEPNEHPQELRNCSESCPRREMSSIIFALSADNLAFIPGQISGVSKMSLLPGPALATVCLEKIKSLKRKEVQPNYGEQERRRMNRASPVMYLAFE